MICLLTIAYKTYISPKEREYLCYSYLILKIMALDLYDTNPVNNNE